MKIIGTGSALPSLSVTNDMLSRFLDTDDHWIQTRTGIQQRRVISKESLKELAVKATQNALDDAGLTAADLDYILCSNIANNYVTPALSCIIQGEIEATCPCLDLNGACAGFLYALDIAEAFLNSYQDKNILIVCAEEPTRFVNWNERSTSVLFGDGAGAVVVTKGTNLKALTLTTTSKVDVLYYRRLLESTPYAANAEGTEPLVMHGKDVFKLAVSSSVADVKKVMQEAGITCDDVSYFLLHQANIRIIDSIREHLNQPHDKFPQNIEKYGNTSSASIPILLDELSRANKIKSKSMLVMSAFGAGFCTGACAIEWD
ncbi:MAG: beta-ketoacyl-ACP synthase 3 [Bacteroidales bacterium]|nr:beta-ketoacyl-ACP synthase 3 [Bacteroidales bacterium]